MGEGDSMDIREGGVVREEGRTWMTGQSVEGSKHQ